MWLSNQFFSVCQSVCLLTDRLSNDYVHNSLPIFTKFCMRLRNVSLRRLLFVRETGSSLRILEVCGFQFWQFSGCGERIFQQISTKSHTQIQFGNADFVFNGEWNRKRNRILEMCKFRICIRSGITSTILYRFSPNFASGSGMSSHRRLFVTQTGSSLLILEVCGFWFRQFSGSGEHIFQQISTRSRA